MENTSTNQSLFDLNFDDNVKLSIRETAIWAGLAAIVSLVSAILGLVNYFVQMNKLKQAMSGFGDYSPSTSATAGGMISPLISLGIGIALFVFLNKFARSAKAGVDANDSYLINEGLGGLSTYFKIVGVLIIIVLVFVALALLFSIAAGV
jgi:hypothetical protein